MRRKTKLKSLLAASAVMVAAIATPATALKYPPDAPSFGGCENSGWVLWEFVDDGCLPTTDEDCQPYYYDPGPADDLTFGSRHFNDPFPGWGGSYGGEPWEWADGVFTVLSEDAINQPIPERGDKQYLRQYFQVVHTLVPGLDESDDRWPIGFAVELWDMSVFGWTGCPQGYETDDGYLGGYEFEVPPEIHYEIPGAPGWYKSVWIHDFSTDGSVYSGEYEKKFEALYDTTHTACIVGMDLDPDQGEIFQIEEVILDFIWFDDPCGNDIPTEPAGSMVGTSSVQIDPPQPSSSDVIAITLSGQWSDSCVPSNSLVWIDGDKINFEVVPNNSACIFCYPAITPWELTGYVGPLSSGTYTVYGYMYRDPNSPVSNPFTFVISDKYYVDAADGNDLNDGRSWATAFATIQKGIDASDNSDEIWVAQGTYKPNDGVITIGDERELTFQLKSGVTVKGGYAGFGETDPNARDVGAYETILSGDLSGDDVGDPEWPEDPSRNDNSYHVVTGSGTDATAVLDGFTVTAGNAPYAGGGMCNDMGSPTVTNCVFSANSAYYYGCGMYNNEASSPTVTNCTFGGNSGGGAGGGMCNTNSSPTLTNCTFSGNSAPGIFISEGGGGGMYNRESNPTLTNCIFSGNSAGRGGGGMSNYYDSSPTLTNCTFTGNTAPVGGGMENAHGSSPILTNCILWGDMPDEILGGLPDVTYCDVEGDWPGEDNIDVDPLFVDPNGPDGIVGTEDDNLRLLAGSPCIDAGDPNHTPAPGETDLDSNPRIVNYTVDMGAYEFQGVIYVDDDASGDPGPGDPDVSDPEENGTEAHPFDEIQEGIDVAQDGHTVLVWPGLYPASDPYEGEAFNFLGKNITLTSTDPADPNKTIIGGTVLFSGTEDPNCTFTGFRIHDLSFGAIYGNHTHATISHCILSGNGPCSATVLENCNGTISNCLITDNTTIFLCGVYPVVFGCHGTIKNCTIANNASGISILDGAEATIENCIIYYNDESSTPQLSVGAGGTLNISYCDVQGGLGGISGAGTVNPGPGNIDTDPCFAQLGYWQEDPFELIEGDYNLKSQAGRWDRETQSRVYDDVTSRCIDAGNPGYDLGDEANDPNNVRIDMGAYGGTAEASMPPHGWALLADLTNDGIVNLEDFAWQAKDWLASGAEQPGDLNRDGIVDITDAAMVATDWLEVTTWAQ